MGFVGDLRVVLGGRDFRRLFTTRLTSQLFDGVFQVALAGYVLFSPERQASAPEAVAALAVVLLPYSALGPFVGVFIDRWPRRQVLVWSALARAALVGLAALLIGDGVPFYLTVLAVMGLNRFFLAALSAGLPHVVPPDQLVMANAVAPTSGTIATFTGAGIASTFQVTMGSGQDRTTLLLVSTAAGYAAAALAATTMARTLLGPLLQQARPQTRQALRNVVNGLIDGGRHVWRRRPATLALAAMALHRLLYGVWTVMTLLLYRNHFHPGRPQAALAGLALIVVASGVGYFAAALVTPVATRRVTKETWIALLLGAAGAVQLTLGATFREVPLIAVGFLLGVAAQGVKICVDTIVQQSIADAYRGRVFSFYDVLFNVAYVAGAACGALLLPHGGRSPAVLVGLGGGYALGAAAYRGLRRRGGALTPDGHSDTPPIN